MSSILACALDSGRSFGDAETNPANNTRASKLDVLLGLPALHKRPTFS